jgi:ferrous iron transport protein B
VTNLLVGLAGNPNSGKTTLFNALTGARQRVGNFPGVTVARHEGTIMHQGATINLVDLPGIYSLSAFSEEEVVARTFILDEKPHLLVDIADATALERSLYLLVQLRELGLRTVLVVNMVDELERSGRRLDSDKLARLLGLPVVQTVARREIGLERALDAVVLAAGQDQPPLTISYGPELDRMIDALADVIERADFLTQHAPPKVTAIKYLEQDQPLIALGHRENPQLSAEIEARAAQYSQRCRTAYGESAADLITDYRYGFISSILGQGVVSMETHLRRRSLTDAIDKVLTHWLAGPAIMLAVLYAVFWMTISLGETPMGWIESLFGLLADLGRAAIPDGLLQSLLVSGVIDGVGAVLGFVPLIALMFLAVSFLEDSGYMARMAYMLDRLFRMFGLHGYSIMAFIVSGGIGGGCAVPGVMAARNLRSPKEKIATILTAPFMSCGAKIPVFTLLAAAFFPGQATAALFWITLASWGFVFVAAKFLRTTIIAGPATPFLMELPPYRLPTCKGLLLHSWERVWQYVRKAGTLILAVSILLWAAMTYPQLPKERLDHYDRTAAVVNARHEFEDQHKAAQLEALEASRAEEAIRHSLAGRIGRVLEPVSALAGFDWRTNIALVGGLAAKEVIVSTLGTAYSLGDVDLDNPRILSQRLEQDSRFTRITAISLILFSMLYAPCFVTVIAIGREIGHRWALFSVAFNTTLAYLVAVLFYQTATAWSRNRIRWCESSWKKICPSLTGYRCRWPPQGNS